MNKNKFLYMQKESAIPCPSGSPIKDEFELVTEGNNMSLKKVGTINVQKQIESYRDSVDLGKMIERYKRGDTSALTRGAGGSFADVSEITPDLAVQIENQRIAAEYVAQAQAAAKTQTDNSEVVKDKGTLEEKEVTNE